MKNHSLITLFFALILACSPCVSYAQSDWQRPVTKKKMTVEEAEKALREAKKAAKEARKVLKAAGEKPENISVDVAEASLDPRYGVGAVPMVNGKVEWEKTYHVKGVKAEALYERMIDILTEIIGGETQTEKSFLSVSNKAERVVAANLDEMLVLKSSFISLDRVEMKYSLIVNYEDEKVVVKMTNIIYNYEEGTPNHMRVTATEWISDDEALNKARTKLYKGSARFRIRTIDRKDQLFALIGERLSEAAE